MPKWSRHLLCHNGRPLMPGPRKLITSCRQSEAIVKFSPPGSYPVFIVLISVCGGREWHVFFVYLVHILILHIPCRASQLLHSLGFRGPTDISHIALSPLEFYSAVL